MCLCGLKVFAESIESFFWESSVCVFPFLLQKHYDNIHAYILLAQNISDSKQENVYLSIQETLCHQMKS